jgi:cytochrome c oxidase subunit 2
MLDFIAGVRAQSAALVGFQSLTGRPVRATVLTTIVSVAGLTGCGARPLPVGVTAQAAALHAIWVAFFRVGAGVAAVVYGLIAWCIVRYRKRAGDTAFPQQFRRNNKWKSSIPLCRSSWSAVCSQSPIQPSVTSRRSPWPPAHRNVTAFRWSWRFDYPQTGTSVVGTAAAPPEFTVNTIPPKTLTALLNHGKVSARTIESGLAESQAT